MRAFGLRKILSTIKTSFIPALILAFCVWFNYALQPFNPSELSFLHLMFYLIVFGTVIFLLSIDQQKPMLITAWILGTYITLNRLGWPVMRGWHFNVGLILLFIATPLNALWFEIMAEGKLLSGKNFNVMLFVLAQAVVIEQIVRLDVLWTNEYLYYIGCGVWLLVLMILLTRMSINGGIESVAYIYAFIALFLAFNSQRETAFVLYFFASVLILFAGMIHQYIYSLFRDPLTGVMSARAYGWKAAGKFPLKYSLGIVCLDNYQQLQKAFGLNRINKLTQMIINVIKSTLPNSLIFRYDSDEFILIFPNEDKKQGYEYLETARRAVAGSTFVINRDTKLKVTVSAGISEKKRSDADADVVLRRTREAVRRAYKFTQNMTSKA